MQLDSHIENSWLPLDQVNICKISTSARGTYKIRLVDERGCAIPIGRFGGTDDEGILYIGKSKFLRRRLQAWLRGEHDGYKANFVSQYIDKMPQGRNSSILEFKISPKDDISQGETEELANHLMQFGELPPYNAVFSGNVYKEILEHFYPNRGESNGRAEVPN